MLINVKISKNKKIKKKNFNVHKRSLTILNVFFGRCERRQ